MSILDKIITEKKKEVEVLKGKRFSPEAIKKVTSFKDRIKDSNSMNIIAEIKRASPSKGAIHMDVNPAAQALEYEVYGAQAISILTDTSFFKGSMDDLKSVRQTVDLPLLCKDFMIDAVQIDQAKAAGANIILLIVAALDQKQLLKLHNYAIKLDLEVLVEVHDKTEMERALKINAQLIGINNRDLNTFNVDLQTTANLALIVTDPNVILISESGIVSGENARTVSESGAQAILVGETLMRATDLKQTFKDFQVPFKQSGQF